MVTALILTLLLQSPDITVAQLIRVGTTSWGKYKTEQIAAAKTRDALVSLESTSVKIALMTAGKSKSVLRLKNEDKARTVKKVEWRLMIYDEQRREFHDKLYLSDEVTIRPGKGGEAAAILQPSGGPFVKAILPGRAFIVAQLDKVTFTDGSSWSAQVECKAVDGFQKVECEVVKNP